MAGCKLPTSMGKLAWCLPPLCAYYSLEKLRQQLLVQLAQPSPVLSLQGLTAHKVISFVCPMTLAYDSAQYCHA